MKTPHVKAYIYTAEYKSNGLRKKSTHILAVINDVDVQKMLDVWNKISAKNNTRYTLQGEIDVMKAIYQRSISDNTIAQDWKLLADHPHHTICIKDEVIA